MPASSTRSWRSGLVLIRDELARHLRDVDDELRGSALNACREGRRSGSPSRA